MGINIIYTKLVPLITLILLPPACVVGWGGVRGAGGMCGGGGGDGALVCVAGKTAIAEGGTHSTGMHSCCVMIL